MLGYLICPLDVIPNPLPIGLLDDLAAISLLLAEMSIYRTEEMEKEVERIMDEFI